MNVVGKIQSKILSMCADFDIHSVKYRHEFCKFLIWDELRMNFGWIYSCWVHSNGSVIFLSFSPKICVKLPFSSGFVTNRFSCAFLEFTIYHRHIRSYERLRKYGLSDRLVTPRAVLRFEIPVLYMKWGDLFWFPRYSYTEGRYHAKIWLRWNEYSMRLFYGHSLGFFQCLPRVAATSYPLVQLRDGSSLVKIKNVFFFLVF